MLNERKNDLKQKKNLHKGIDKIKLSKNKSIIFFCQNKINHFN